jgi:hypothetical protein
VLTRYSRSSTLHHVNIVETVDLVQDEAGRWCEVMEVRLRSLSLLCDGMRCRWSVGGFSGRGDLWFSGREEKRREERWWLRDPGARRGERVFDSGAGLAAQSWVTSEATQSGWDVGCVARWGLVGWVGLECVRGYQPGPRP